jgi:phage terminase Nu1 subunit (DNA packaging protein)
LDIRPKTVSHLVARGMPHEARGRYDVRSCFAWYVKYLHRQMSQRGMGEEERASGASLRMERHRLLRAQADREELELLERRKQVIPLAIHVDLLMCWVVTIRQRLLQLPVRLAGLLAGQDRRGILDTLDREIREVLLILKMESYGNGHGITRGAEGCPGPGLPEDPVAISCPVSTESK